MTQNFKDHPIVYHGSKKKFTSFDARFIGTNGTQEGIGFYFTNSKRIGNVYAEDGFLYTAKFNGFKQLCVNDFSITKSDLRKLIEAIEKEMDYLSNWGEVAFEGYETIIERALEKQLEYTDNDVDLIASLYTDSGRPGRVLELVYETLGYDSIIVENVSWGKGQVIYIALIPDVIEIIEIEDKRKFARELNDQQWREGKESM